VSKPSATGEGAMDSGPSLIGHPRVHLRQTDSTNERARALAIAGSPHGTLVSASEQTAGRGRQGRAWAAPADSALLCSLVLRDPPPLLSLIAGIAVCDAVGERALVKWPNDVVLESSASAAAPAATGALESDDEQTPGRPAHGPALAKLAGILVEGRPQEKWAVLGIGVNVAVRIEQLPAEVRTGAASLERLPSAIEPLLASLLDALARRLAEPADALLDAWRARDALHGREIAWAQGQGRAEGIDDEGRLLVCLEDGARTALSAGEVHFESVG
jgi:BirA family transcriptional regulator, biotin operon repressor / biotin---[acetyl-CoA-carboxylase] ligase